MERGSDEGKLEEERGRVGIYAWRKRRGAAPARVTRSGDVKPGTDK